MAECSLAVMRGMLPRPHVGHGHTCGNQNQNQNHNQNHNLSLSLSLSLTEAGRPGSESRAW
eukprot:10965193-Heterocapsa_arctica.AAC.1